MQTHIGNNTPHEGVFYAFATNNPGKMKEINLIFAEYGLQVHSLADIGLDCVVEENGSTFAENALIKAKSCAEAIRAAKGLCLPDQIAVLADDSGLCIDALDGRPGVYSARFLGENTSYDIKNRQILDMLNPVPEEQRTARFVCVIACVLPDGRCLTAEGTVEGIIARAPRGVNGFGYDPIFYLPEYGMTTAELPPEVKNTISHRGRALNAMLASMTKSNP